MYNFVLFYLGKSEISNPLQKCINQHAKTCETDAELLKEIIDLSYNNPLINFTTTAPQDIHNGLEIELHSQTYIPNMQCYKGESSMKAQRNVPAEVKINTIQSRASTFISQKWKNVKYYPMHMAEAGFYYRGEGNYVHCFTCKIKSSVDDWFDGETPSQAHVRLKSDCQFVIDSKLMLTPRNLINEHHETSVEKISNQTLVKQENKTEQQRQEYKSKREERQPADLIKTNFSMKDDQTTVDCNSSFNELAVVETDAMNCQLDDVVFKYDQYENFELRLQTFKNWKYESKQTPRDLAKAGFFYTGKKEN